MKISNLSRAIPKAVERLGRPSFATMDAYPLDPQNVRILYIQKDLLESTIGRPMDDAEARRFVERTLLLTLDPRKGIPGAEPVTVYVDRQADPMNMSLNGNLGSGRAVYVGERFNIKGLGKTVLATSGDPMHSNGNLDLVSALWEMFCSNVLQTNLRTGTSPVLAVVDLRTPIHVPWREPMVPSGLIVRLDGHGELDRPTHLFQMNQPVKADRLRTIAANLGRQDAEKFIERILHGCWSAGNTSLDGHLLDYDTVFAIRGRAPQWSYRPNWLSDFFGIEGQGQKKLLKAMVNHPINVDRVSFRELFRIFDAARQHQLEQRFLDLIGADPAWMIPFPSTAWSGLVKQFQEISMKMYPNFRATAPWELDNSNLSVYDLSRFFRFYPILRATGPLDEETALRLIRNPAGTFETSDESGIPESVRKILVRDYVVSSPDHLQALDRQALDFVAKFENLLCILGKEFPESRGAMIQRAYVVNEERTYMNCRPGNDTFVALVQNSTSGKIGIRRFSELLHLLIAASDRIPRPDAKGRCQADLRLFMDGFTSNLVGPRGTYQPRLTLLATPMNDEPARQQTPKPPPANSWEVELGGKKHVCHIEDAGAQIHIIGPEFPLSQLSDAPCTPSFFLDGALYQLQPISREDR